MLFLNDNEIVPTLFSDHTSQVWKLKEKWFDTYEYDIDWNFQHEGEFLQLAQLVDLIRKESDKWGPVKINLYMNYLPYARQDKKITNETTFALNTFADLLNNLKLDKVSALDVHSDMANLINNFTNVFPYHEIYNTVKVLNPDVICFPDKGARDRYSKNLISLNKTHVYAEKVRNQQTGEIISLELKGPVLSKNVLIVDDITDGGMTFIKLTELLEKEGAYSVNLYTTHGIFSKGLLPLREAGIQRIFTKDGEATMVGSFGIAYKELK